MNLEKNSRAKLIDTAARIVGVAMGILMYGSIFMMVARFESSLAVIDVPFLFYLIPAAFSSVMAMGAGMGGGYIRSILMMPDGIAWLAIAVDAFFFTLFYVGLVAMLIALVLGPLFVAFSCCPFFTGLGYWIIARWRLRRSAGPETETTKTEI